MEKIELGTPDGTVENIERIAELFPQVVTCLLYTLTLPTIYSV